MLWRQEYILKPWPPFQHTTPRASLLWSKALKLSKLLALVWLSLGAGWTITPSWAEASDVRLALLVGNQQGWSGDPLLQYAVKGDLRPMARELRRIGFRVVRLEDQNADALRHALERIRKRLLQKPTVTTFLFYYSGHADKSFFHLGPKGKRPFSYHEFRKRFYRLRSLRRIAIIDACYSGQIVREFGSEKQYRKLLQRGFPKGVRGQRKPNLIQLLRPSQGHEKGLRVIGSSRFLSWEIRRYRASVFTHHLLQGLQGTADLNRDGKISLDELFDFARQSVYRDTGQRPQQYKQVLEGEPYALAPAYQSRLRIDAQVVGRLKISVANFVWYKTKHVRRPLRIAMVHGRGSVHLKQGRQCWRQPIQLPAGGEGRLSHRRWQKVPCARMAFVPKGSVEVPVARARAPVTSQNSTVSFSSGYLRAGDGELGTNHLAWSLGYRWRYLGAGLEYATGFVPTKQFLLHRLALRLDAGYPFRMKQFQVFLGAFFRIGTTLQSYPSAPTYSAVSLGSGGILELAWWSSQRWGLKVGAHLGFDYTPVLEQTGFSLFLQTHISFFFSL
ncbi:MAG: caspase family protein [Deltaproteobacteria bacterium]|nr:MAG: caspase family protein [Deltaproteobacteria bacterium]